MNHTTGFQTALLAAAIALALGSTSAMAATAPPAANQLPGGGQVLTGGASGVVTPDGKTLNVTLPTTTVIDWGKGTDINKDGVAGFNIGSGATVNFIGSVGVLNVDSTGNPSQIMGTLTAQENVFVANANGIIVGANASISSPTIVGLIANQLASGATATFDGTAAPAKLEFDGAGGNVTVLAPAPGKGIAAPTVLVSGGSVNIDLGALIGGAWTLQAGMKNSTSGIPANDPSAVLTATGDLGAATLASFASAGDASSSGTLALGSNARVDGTLTNTGDLNLGTGFAIDGRLLNNKTVTQSDDVLMGSLANNGFYVGGGFDLTTTDGGIANSASMTGLNAVVIQHGGDFTNDGVYASSGVLDVYRGGSVTNRGVATALGIKIREGGDFTNVGEMTLDAGAGELIVLNGNVINSGQLSAATLTMASDSGAGLGFTEGTDYSVVNTGTVTSAGSLIVVANLRQGTTANESTGSFTSTGTLRVGSGGSLTIGANDDVNLAGNVQAKSGTAYKALTAANALTNFSILASGAGWGLVLAPTGVANVTTDIVASGSAIVIGSQVKLMSDIAVADATGALAGDLTIGAGAKQAAGYAVRVASGKTLSAGIIGFAGDQLDHQPNIILQGSLVGGTISFGGASRPVSDVYTGPNSSVSMVDYAGTGTALNIAFTGAVKTVPYNNSATNFRFNGLKVTTDGTLLALTLNPVAYTTNGTSNGKSAINLLVNGDVNLLASPITAPVDAGGSAVTGVANIPNTHLVLQSSGNILVGQVFSPPVPLFADFYWPGYVYLGNVAADDHGNALPGTLGMGTITTAGKFNNVLPGDLAGASGIHFITQFPVSLGGAVVTNANAWVNFGTELLTAKFANEQGSTGPFFGGSQGPGTVINYGALDASSFNTATPSSTR